MTDKQIIIYKKECYNEPYCSLNQVLEQLKAKEQECEELNKELHKNFEEKDTLHLIIDRLLEASGYDTNTASAEDFEDVYEHMRYEQQQLDQLKAENEELKGIRDRNFLHALEEQDRADKYFKTLTEIKVLSENVYCLTNALNRDMALFAKEILQKISEVLE